MLAERLLAPVAAADVDALLFGCTHYPFLARVIGDVMGPGVTLVGSADETAFAARRILGELGLLGDADRVGAHRFLSSGDIEVFRGPRRAAPRARAQPHGTMGAADPLIPERGSHAPSRRTRPRRAATRSSFERDFTEMAAGSCLVSFGRTRVLCTASIDEDVPRWMRGRGKGWVTAEYSMLPGSSPERVDREAAKGKQSGRTVEIQRLIGRALRAACDMARARRAPGRRRLRRAAGRRRDAHGEHLRRLPRPARRPHPAGAAGQARRPTRCTRTARRSASASSAGRRCSTCPTSRTARPRST